MQQMQNGVDYVTVLDKTKYSTVARRMLLLATAINIKRTKRGLILLNRSVLSYVT